jgi:hypothetical protein
VQAAEAGVRGYLLTGNPAFLESLDVARTQLPERLTRLEQLMIDPIQHAVLRDSLTDVSGARFVVMERPGRISGGGTMPRWRRANPANQDNAERGKGSNESVTKAEI